MEGIDGSGTTTHSKLLSEFLETKGYKTHLTKEPSSGEIGLLLRKFLKRAQIHPSTDALLFAADRSHHFFTEIESKLTQNYVVISDRFLESSIVYQSAQSQLISVQWIKTLNKFIKEPDMTMILDLPPKKALERKEVPITDKFENIEFLKKVRKLYLERAQENNYYIINSNDLIEVVQKHIQKLCLEELDKIS